MELLVEHIIFYLPFWISALSLYLTLKDAFYSFDWSYIPKIISKVLYSAFFFLSSYNVEVNERAWFSMVSMAVSISLVDEIIFRLTRGSRTKEIVSKNTAAILNELLKQTNIQKGGPHI